MSADLGGREDPLRTRGRAAAGRPEPLASLAAVAARQQRHADARSPAEQALALRPDLIPAHMAIARADLSRVQPTAPRRA